MRTPNSLRSLLKVDDEFMVIKSMSVSFIVYKDNWVVYDKKVSHYLMTPWVDYEWKKKHVDIIRWYTVFKASEHE